MDPPLTRRGRVARYGRRHLLQLVAVKRRQAEGRSLAEIQAELVGATDLALERIARLPDEAARSQPRPASPTEPAPAAPGRFWAARPASPTPSAAAEGPSVITGLSLAPGVTLLLDPAPQHLTNADVAALTAAAGPLLAAIRERGLTPAPSDPDSRRKGSQP